MKILVLSDSHGQQRYMEQAVFAEGPDYILHLGDKQCDGLSLHEKFCGIPYLGVPGNCDYAPLDVPVVVTELGGVRFLVTHGHKHDVKTGFLRLCYAAAEAGAQVAVFGHTHQALSEQQGNLWLLNPGAASGGTPSYGVVEIKSEQEISCRVEYL